MNMALTLLTVVLLVLNAEVTRLHSLSQNVTLPKTAYNIAVLGSVQSRLITADSYHLNQVHTAQSRKTNVNNERKDTGHDFQSQGQGLNNLEREDLNVTNRILSNYVSLFAERNDTIKRNLSHFPFTEKRKRVETPVSSGVTVPTITWSRPDTERSFPRHSISSTDSFSRTSPVNMKQFDTESFNNTHERDKDVRLNGHTEQNNRQNYRKTPDKIYTDLSNSANASKNLKHTQLEPKIHFGGNYKECPCQNTKCDCSKRQLTSVPQDLNPSITELLLNNNKINKLPNDVFSRYGFLENLDLSDNFIGFLKNGSFNGLTRLVSLDLSVNFFRGYKDIHRMAFEPLKSLKILRLNVSIIGCNPGFRDPDTALSHLHKLEELYLDNYIFSESKHHFGPGFNNMTSLRHLSINCQSCKILGLWNTTFQNLGQITSLDIRRCGINGSYVESGTFSELLNLIELDISRNRNIGLSYLPNMLWGLGNSSLQTLRMNYIVNEYSPTVVDNNVVLSLPRGLTTLVARGNNILYIDREAVKNLPKSLKIVDISDNNIIMNPEAIPLYEMAGLESLLIDSGQDECFKNDKDNTVDLFREMSDFEELRNKNIESNETENRIPGTEKQGSIPLPFGLKHVKINVKNMHDDLVFKIDKRNNLRELDLSCSYIPEFNFFVLMKLSKLKLLDLERSSIRLIYCPKKRRIPLERLFLRSNYLGEFMTSEDKPFNCFSNLTHLDLSENQINQLHKDSFFGLDNLEYLRLDNNPLSYFDIDISSMGHLMLLSFHSTELSYLINDVRSHIDLLCNDRPGQIRVDMANCPIQCDCFNLDFLKWMVSSAAFDKNFTRYKCKYPDTSSRYILDGYQETIRVLDRECAKNYPMFLIVLAGTSVLLFAVVGAILYRLRWKIRYLYYAAYLKFTDKHKNDNNHEFTYDVFISYDSEDHAFVTRSLSPELENRGLKLLIHGRDFVAGTYITSNIVMAVTESRKTLVVLTRNLLESTWCNYELQMATMEAVYTGRQVLVFLLKENIPSRELDVELLGHIRSNTYLPYPASEEEGDVDIMTKFYDKLAHDLRC